LTKGRIAAAHVQFKMLLHHLATNLVAIGETVTEIWRFFVFLKMAAVRHVGFLKVRDF